VGLPYVNEDARHHFSMRVAPDQSVLVLDSDTSGKWPLVRFRKWWTDTPVREMLDIPGWSSADAKHLDTLHVDVQITPDGRYAVAFAGADWMEKSDFIFFAPPGYVARKPDTIITVVDLEQWRIVSSIHTMGIADGTLGGVRVLSDKWIVLDFSLGESPLKRLLYRFDSRLISVPDLRPGAGCISDRPFRGPSVSPGLLDPKPFERHNDAVCQDVLQTAGTTTVKALEILIDRGQDVLPIAVRQSSRRDPEIIEDEFFRDWGDYPYYDGVYENPPLESASHQWYGLYGSQDRDFYELSMFDVAGHRQKAQTVRNLLCGDSSLEKHGLACGCRVVDASEQHQDVLARCRTQHGDYTGMVRREWLSVIRTDDFSGARFISLTNKDRETLHEMALGDGHPYVVTLESGEILRVYAIPERP
jgi:hypothetical protein